MTLGPEPHFTIQQVYLHSYLHLLGITIFYYDYVLTFKDEYKRFWRKPGARPSLMFFVNRYVTFFGDVAVNVGNFYAFTSEEVCKHYALYRTVLLIVAQVIVCVILCLRIYALYRQDKRVLGLVVGAGLTLLAFSCWASFGQTEWVDIQGGCHTALPWISSIRTAVPWEALFLYDVMIFTLTLYKTVKERAANPASVGRFDIIALIFRDGAIYFAVMACANLGNVVTFYVVTPLLRGCLSTFASSVSVTMMSRLMLNLHEGTVPSGSAPTDAVSTQFVFSSRPAGGPQSFASDDADFSASGSGSGSGSRGADSLSFGVASGSRGAAETETYASEREVREAVELHDLHARHRQADEVSV